jgi:GNAT superfamily N-acetyltransferase
VSEKGVSNLAEVKRRSPVAVARDPRRLVAALDYRLYARRRPLRLGRRRVELLDRVLDGMRDFSRLMCATSEGARLLEPEGIVAAVMPSVPEQTLMNAVVYERAGALAAAFDDLTATYDDAGIDAWMVIVPAVDRQAKRLVKRAGHRLEGTSGSAMARNLRGLERPERPFLEEWTATGDPAAMAAICDRAFGTGTAFARAFARPLPEGARVYLASLDGVAVTSVLATEYHGNCAVDLVATVPEARGRGMAGGLLAHVLADAARRGCSIATVASGRPSRPVYDRLGFRPVCPLQKWVRRRPPGLS